MDSEVINMIAIRFGIFAGIMLFCFPFLLGFAFRCIEPVIKNFRYSIKTQYFFQRLISVSLITLIQNKLTVKICIILDGIMWV